MARLNCAPVPPVCAHDAACALNAQATQIRATLHQPETGAPASYF
nr:hypothetical protein [uncultured Cupriavidus sp.]